MYSTCRRYPDRARRRPISPAGSSWRRARRGRGHAGAKAGGLPLVGTAAANGRRAPATTIGEIRGELRGADRGDGQEPRARPLLRATWPTFADRGERPPELRACARGRARCRRSGAAKRRLPPAWGETGAGWPPLTACALRVVTTYRHAGGKDRAGPVGASCLTHGGGLGSVSGILARARAREGRPDAGGGWA